MLQALNISRYERRELDAIAATLNNHPRKSSMGAYLPKFLPGNASQ
ncbi:hypothetical protein SAMN04490220_0930 [Rhodococcus jostii]|uniref:Transposase n=1 Tax=Rhodococcus jostii TaxID=132919 RepID=A0A1H4JIP9_RHOJO|nr:hypothetical protein SAMN04490220_0930 [Rhodococcus jostii]